MRWALFTIAAEIANHLFYLNISAPGFLDMFMSRFILYKLPISPKLGDTTVPVARAECAGAGGQATPPPYLSTSNAYTYFVLFRLIFILHMYTYIWPWLS